jgi:hypothetical protein
LGKRYKTDTLPEAEQAHVSNLLERLRLAGTLEDFTVLVKGACPFFSSAAISVLQAPCLNQPRTETDTENQTNQEPRARTNLVRR